MKVLNNYCGLGGNRLLWPPDVKVTAVEHNEEIAALYKKRFPYDEVIVGDAHDYLLRNYKRFDFIWGSPPCPTHGRLNHTQIGRGADAKYPDMKLYQEIILLMNWFDGKFTIENVIPYYEPLIKPTVELQRHLFWSNFKIRKIEFEDTDVVIANISANDTVYGFSLKGVKINHRKDQILRNCVNPELGLYILEQAMGIIRQPKIRENKLF